MADSNNAEFSDDLVDWTPSEPTGYEEEFAKRDTCEALCGIGARDFPDHLWIEPRDWRDVAAMNDRYKTWPEDWRNRFTNQSPTHECTCHALLQNMEIAWNRQRQSKSDAVWFSALSVYSEANSRRWGGSTMQHTLGICMNRGILPEHNGPNGPDTQRSRFAHTLPVTSGNVGGGRWIPVSQFPVGWRQTAKHFRPLEVINVSSWEEHVCLVLNGFCVSNGRAGHAIPHVKVVYRSGELYSMYSDSYNVLKFDSVRMIKAGVGGAYSIVSTTLPDSFDDPAPVG